MRPRLPLLSGSPTRRSRGRGVTLWPVSPSLVRPRPLARALGKGRGNIMALIKCKECGNEISSKAETCPKCGMRLKASPKSNSGSGCIVGFFKLIGGLVGGLIGLGVAISLLSNNSVSPTRQLEIRCEEASKTQANESDIRAFYESCIAAGSSQIKAQERINQEQNTESNSEKLRIIFNRYLLQMNLSSKRKCSQKLQLHYQKQHQLKLYYQHPLKTIQKPLVNLTNHLIN